MKLSLVIPCYNEEANLPLLLEACQPLRLNGDIEVIIVDNGSTDGTSEVLKRLLPSYPHCRTVRVSVNQGYGFGILYGLMAAQGNILAWTHADLQTDPKDVLRCLELFNRYGETIFVKGRRIKRPLTDVAFTVGMSIFETLLLRTRLWDINAQPNIFSRSFFESWVNPPHDFSLDLYVYFTARHKGLPVYRFPVEFGERAHGVSHWNVNWAGKWKFIRRTIDFSFELKKRLSQ
ncbi:glycosyltransferase family 2 protein [Polynucleobacter sp. MG-5-Ahmo-C2]|uniref:glycosyltransferase family 2 protein n=1 Tax=Polynucleobacter sp. MG-5-Ahmo-C2 TaxID=2081051 RepID=UPI001BFD283C|nr:glycosyltransferase family 2 protein [Polynucleobacter sp. MG-5-Ahmo-C2]QWD98821.1 glycosyltransferase family 2 protein [Polynucleobacter sp. MG-5-Ahmo-C2]